MSVLQEIYRHCATLEPRAGKQSRLESCRRREADLIDLLWSSDEVRSRKTLVYDEINNGLHYFNVSLFQAIPQVYRNLRSALNDIYPELEKMVLPPLLRFGSWIGGDRDGNPFVTHETTEQAVLMHADNVLRYYSKQLKHLRKRLLHCASIIAIDPAIDARNEHYARLGVTVFDYNPEDYNNEPYRRLLALMRAKIQHTNRYIQSMGEDQAAAEHAYPNAEAFLDDLILIRNALKQHDPEQARGDIQDLIRLVRSCGFHMASLDIRQESTWHTSVVADLFAHAPNLPDYNALDEAGRQQALSQLIAAPGTAAPFRTKPLARNPRTTGADAHHRPPARTRRRAHLRQLHHLHDQPRQPHPRSTVPDALRRPLRAGRTRPPPTPPCRLRRSLKPSKT